MSFLEAFKLAISFFVSLKNFLLKVKKTQIINAKNEALEKGDQRGLENAISSDNNDPVDLPIGKYNGMYERAVKKKS